MRRLHPRRPFAWLRQAVRAILAIFLMLAQAVPGAAAYDQGRTRPFDQQDYSGRSRSNRAAKRATIRDVSTPETRAKIERTLERIDRGEHDRHPNDGSVYRNLNRVLPREPHGYYREYVYRPKHARSVGPERVIVGDGGEVYYTPDHYDTFQRFTR